MVSTTPSSVFKLAFNMKKLRCSWLFFKSSAHNVLVVARWLEYKCFGQKDTSAYSLLRWRIMWRWVELFDICPRSDPDFLTAAELNRLRSATDMFLQGSKVLAAMNASLGKARWKLRPKLHRMFHIVRDAESSGRNPRAW